MSPARQIENTAHKFNQSGGIELWNWTDPAVCGGALFNTRIHITGGPQAMSEDTLNRAAALFILSLISKDYIADARQKLADVLEWQQTVVPHTETEVYRIPLRRKVVETRESAPIDFD